MRNSIMTSYTKIVTDPLTVTEQLEQLGLNPDQLKIAVAKGQAARNNATSHHPANAGGTMAFFEVVRALRDMLVHLGWKKQDIRNLSMTANPESNIAIVVSGGCKNTGIVDGIPTTRNPKGKQTERYLSHNQLDMFNPIEIDSDSTDDSILHQTWLLLYFYDCSIKEVRSELSLPTTIDSFGKVCGWRTRILLEVIPLDNDPIKLEPDYSPEIDIDIERSS